MLPFLNNARQSAKKQIVAFKGINYSDQYQDGELRDCMNLSARRTPYLTTRRAREKLDEYSGVTAMTVRGGLVFVRGTDLVYDGEVVGQVTAGEKQFAVVNTKLVIWPDKKYLDLTDKTLHSLAAAATGTGAKFDKESGDMTVTGTDWPDLTTMFKIGDGVEISGCTVSGDEGTNNLTLVVKGVAKNLISFGSDALKVDAEETGEISVGRNIPDLDFIFESENRLWGCCNADQTIYASALGKPDNFFVYAGLSTDSYALAVGSDGEFTGGCKYSSSVLFWKEHKLHKILGSYPAEYILYSYDIEGLRRGSHKSLQVINEVLYYLGLHGVYAYTGSMPQLISANFGEKTFTDGVGGNDGDTYYLSAMEDGTHNLLVYETRSGQWMREDSTNALDFARLGTDMYMLDDTGSVWLMDTRQDDPEVNWVAQFTPFHETAEGRKLFSKIVLRVEMPRGSWLKADIRPDGGKWRTVGKVLGREADSIPMVLPINRCDQFELKLSGSGPCTIKSLLLEYTIGSDA